MTYIVNEEKWNATQLTEYRDFLFTQERRYNKQAMYSDIYVKRIWPLVWGKVKYASFFFYRMINASISYQDGQNSKLFKIMKLLIKNNNTMSVKGFFGKWNLAFSEK